MTKTLLAFILGVLSTALLAWLVLAPEQPFGPGPKLAHNPPSQGRTVQEEAHGLSGYRDLDGKDSDPAAASGDRERIRQRQATAADWPESVPGPDREEAWTSAQGSSKGSAQGDAPSSALDWFARGIDLNDDSEQEMHCYLKAVKLDPEFAPAYYRLGALLMRNGDFAEAREAFAAFWIHASEQDKQEYNLTLYTSPEELTREIAVLRGEPLEKDTQGEGNLVQFESDQGQIIVPVLLNQGVQTRMILDTGAAITVISPELAERAGVRPDGTIHLTTIASGNIRARLGTVSSLKIGNRVKRNVRVAVVDIGLLKAKRVDGLVGMDLLRDARVSIDQDRQVIEIQTRRDQKHQGEHDAGSE